MSGDDLITLGLLPPSWPNHGEEWKIATDDALRTDFPADRNLSETERYTNALLTISLGKDDSTEVIHNIAEESMDTDEDGPDL